MSINNQKLLYHLTSLDNLESILSYGLLSRTDINDFDDVADLEIIDFRERNNLTQYIPFHFFARNPFDGRVQKNYPDKEFIYICVSRDFAKRNNFKILPRHPNSMRNLTLYDYSEGYEIIEWDIMNRRDYSERDCRHICMAECLSPSRISPQDFSNVFVRTDDIEEFVREQCMEILDSYPFYINVNPHMFVE
jgi:hypothetical protein